MSPKAKLVPLLPTTATALLALMLLAGGLTAAGAQETENSATTAGTFEGGTASHQVLPDEGAGSHSMTMSINEEFDASWAGMSPEQRFVQYYKAVHVARLCGDEVDLANADMTGKIARGINSGIYMSSTGGGSMDMSTDHAGMGMSGTNKLQPENSAQNAGTFEGGTASHQVMPDEGMNNNNMQTQTLTSADAGMTMGSGQMSASGSMAGDTGLDANLELRDNRPENSATTAGTYEGGTASHQVVPDEHTESGALGSFPLKLIDDAEEEARQLVETSGCQGDEIDNLRALYSRHLASQ